MKAEFNPVLYWYLLEAPGLLGETSSHEAIVLMIQSGGSATTIASSDPYHESIIDRLDIERADPVAQARRCDLAWSFLCPLDRRILRGRYSPRTVWPFAMAPNLGDDLVGVCLAIHEDPLQLERACNTSTNKRSKAYIKEAIEEAHRELRIAHHNWDRMYSMTSPPKKPMKQRVEKFRETLP